MVMNTDAIVAEVSSRKAEITNRLFEFLRIPSVSTDPAFADGMNQARNFVLSWLKASGMSDVQLLEGGGHPAVYASWEEAPGKPTILIYGHYDVMPPDPLDAWASPPFEPTLRGGRIYGRGTSDVKASTVIAVESVAAFLRNRGNCPVNVKIFIEGEEESGSGTLRTIVSKYSTLLQADGMISADGGRVSADHPTINVGCRGLVEFEFSIQTAHTDLHSGRYGGVVRNAVHEMARLVASLHDEDGNVAITELMETLPAPSEFDRRQTSELPFDEKQFVDDVGGISHGEPAFSLRERLTLRPALDINGMWGGYTGPGSKTIIPNTATAKLSLRTSAGIDHVFAADCIKRHLQARCPEGVRLTISDPGTGSPAFELSRTSPLLVAAQRVLERSGEKPVHVRLGATVPITAIFQEMLGLETLMFGFNLPDEDVHAPNEFFRVKSIDEGLDAWPRLLEELGTFSPIDFRNDR